MTKNRQIAVAAVLVGLVLIAIAIIYWASTAASLPSFFPGHKAGSTTHHFKHGLAAFLLALACFVLAWFQTGPKTAARAREVR